MTTDVPPPSDAEAARLAAERWHVEHEARLRAERRVAELEARLAEMAEPGEHRESISLFDDPQPVDERSLAAEGSDAAVLPMALTGTAIVAGLATLLAFLNDRLGFAVMMLAVTIVLGWFARATWVVPVVVSVNRGVVYIDHGETKHRFDLRNERTQVETSGHPGDRDWEVRFLRRGLDPFVVRAGMVDPTTFLQQLREYRPDL
jgi:hypothetical protein